MRSEQDINSKETPTNVGRDTALKIHCSPSNVPIVTAESKQKLLCGKCVWTEKREFTGMCLQ